MISVVILDDKYMGCHAYADDFILLSAQLQDMLNVCCLHAKELTV